jgi:hypothetical protein
VVWPREGGGGGAPTGVGHGNGWCGGSDEKMVSLGGSRGAQG